MKRIGSALLCVLGIGMFGEVLGEDRRPYEFREANRTEDDYPALADFEGDASLWRIEAASNVVTSVSLSDEQQAFGQKTLKIVYRATGAGTPSFCLEPLQPLAFPADADAVSAWIWFDHFGLGANKDPETPTPRVRARYRMADGTERVADFCRIVWRSWHRVQRRLPPGAMAFLGFTVEGVTQTTDRVIHIDNFSAFKEILKPLPFKPRPQRNLVPLKGADAGLNTGAGRLPFPTREETILPDVEEPRPGDVLAQFNGFAVKGTATNLLEVTSKRVGRTLIVDFYAPPGAVTELSAGYPHEAAFERTVDVPYLALDGGARAGVDILKGGLFRLGLFDWYRSNASAIRVLRDAKRGCEMRVVYNPKSDGTSNALSERLFITLSPDFAGVLPNIPNPVSPYKHIAGKKLWRVHAANDPAEDRYFWTAAHRYGLREVVINDHETQWRDGGESFTLRTKAAPEKGGDAWMTDYSKYLRDDLGYVYGPYNNFTDFGTANRNWDERRIARGADLEFAPAWMRCYAFRPTYAPEACETFAPILKKKFGFNTAYCDVHTAVAFWNRTDYDARAAGAATASETFYAWGETMLLQKKAWQGPVYSEGNHHMFFSGLTDGNYAQDWGYRLDEKPWLVDLDLLRIHPLECNFGIGSLPMFAPGKTALERIFYQPHAPTEKDRVDLVDRFLACTLAFGHTGFLVLDYAFTPVSKPFGRAYGPKTEFDFARGLPDAFRSYYMIQQIAARYTQVNVATIRYVDESGALVPTSEAVLRDLPARQQVAVVYADGTVVVANGSKTSRLRTTVAGRALDLPPCGFAAWTADGEIEVLSSDAGGARFDYCQSPAYIYIDGRGTTAVRNLARANGPAVCRRDGSGWELIPLKGTSCAFKISATKAEALDFDGKSLGPAEWVRDADGFVSVKPVPNAVSYHLEP